MTRYDRIVKYGKSEMAIAIAFCTATYIEGATGKDFSCEALKEFINAQSEPLEKWLSEEVEDD